MQSNSTSAQPQEVKEALLVLRMNRSRLTRQQTRTLHGQIVRGQHKEAMIGLETILQRKLRIDYGESHKD